MYLRGWALVAVAACGDSGGGGGTDAPAVDAAIDAPVGMLTIGPEGGAVASSDGVLTLTVPPGALATATMITVDVMPQAMWPASIVPANPIGAVYSIGPEGTVFAVPATLEWKFATAPAATKDSAGRPYFISGLSRSATDVITPHLETRSRRTATGSLTVVSQIAHLSEQLLTLYNYKDDTFAPSPTASIDVDLRGGRHAVGSPWDASKISVLPFEPELSVLHEIGLEWGAPVVSRSSAAWQNDLEYQRPLGWESMGNFVVGTPFSPSPLPRWECTSVGMGYVKATYMLTFSFQLHIAAELTEDVDCYDREQKPEYTVEAGLLGQTRIAPLAAPGTAMINLADHQGAYGHQVCLLPGQTITVCVGASMPTAVNYYPQYPPGFTFVDGAPGSGCVTLTNLDPNDSNCVLVKSAGGGSPNNVTVNVTVP